MLGIILSKEKRIFDIHSQDLRYLYQLKVRLSQLKAHKHRHSFSDISDNACACKSGVEPTIHFSFLSLFECPQR